MFLETAPESRQMTLYTIPTMVSVKNLTIDSGIRTTCLQWWHYLGELTELLGHEDLLKKYVMGF